MGISSGPDMVDATSDEIMLEASKNQEREQDRNPVEEMSKGFDGSIGGNLSAQLAESRTHVARGLLRCCLSRTPPLSMFFLYLRFTGYDATALQALKSLWLVLGTKLISLKETTGGAHTRKKTYILQPPSPLHERAFCPPDLCILPPPS